MVAATPWPTASKPTIQRLMFPPLLVSVSPSTGLPPFPKGVAVHWRRRPAPSLRNRRSGARRIGGVRSWGSAAPPAAPAEGRDGSTSPTRRSTGSGASCLQSKGELAPGGDGPRPPTCLTVLRVVGVVASLAQRRQVEQAGRFGALVKDVGRGQDHPAAGRGVWLAIDGPAPLTPAPRTVQPNEPAAERPIRRVSGCVLRSDRHYALPFPASRSCAATARRARCHWFSAS